MADVAKLHHATCDKPVEKQDENFTEETNFCSGQSPVQGGQSSATTISHPHDSEYDTASELEGGDDEDEYEDDDDESLGADEEDELDDDESADNGSISGFDSSEQQRQRGDGQEQNEYLKKVDEDRSNPQYIPKRGTFYEHDDRTAEDPREDNANKIDESGEGDNTKPQTPVTSSASKTMKKWQQASAVDRWSHDRYDENEQAPKSRAELVSAYGYDIRSEDGPPRARRRRRYGRGPSRYNRNWEDESAYIKSTVVMQRKPRPEDFPALGDRDKKNRKTRNYREEKENRYDRHNEKSTVIGGSNYHRYVSHRGGDKDQRPGGAGGSDDHKNDHRRHSNKSFRQNRPSNMEFKNQQNKNRSSYTSNNNNNRDKDDMTTMATTAAIRHSNISSLDDRNNKTQVESVSFTNTKANGSNLATNMNSNTNHSDNRYNGHENISISKIQPQQQQIQHSELKDKISNINSNAIVNSRQMQQQQLQLKQQHQHPQQSQLQTRLQQIQQSRNDTVSAISIPQQQSHVGNVQMHSIVTQNPSVIQEMPQTNNGNTETNRTAKRYSSLRQRSQNDSTMSHPSQQPQLDQHNLQQIQQMHDHHHSATQNQAATQSQHMILQDQHLLQANLMQLYHTQQENIQAQIQGVTMQGIPTVPTGVPGVQTNHQSKPPAQYQNVQQQYQTASPAAPPAAAYYSSTTDYPSGPPPPQTIQSQYGQQQQATAAAYIQQQTTNAPQMAAFNTQNQPGGPPPGPPQPMPSTLNYVQSSATAAPNAPATPYQNYSGYQNYNTVGGTTYFVPQQQPPVRSVVPPQRRPTNAIPILAPPSNDKSKKIEKDDENRIAITTTTGISSVTVNTSSSTTTANAPVGSAENIDHILDNMFVQRPPYQPPTRKSSSPATESVGTSTVTVTTTAATTILSAPDNGNSKPITSSSAIEQSSTVTPVMSSSSVTITPTAAITETTKTIDVVSQPVNMNLSGLSENEKQLLEDGIKNISIRNEENSNTDQNSASNTSTFSTPESLPTASAYDDPIIHNETG